MSHKKLVHKEIGIGVALLLTISVLGWLVIPTPEVINSRFWAKWLFLYSLPLFFGVLILVLKRYNHEELIKGSVFSNDGLEIERAYMQNTLEQTVIALPIVISFGVLAPMSLVKFIPLHAIVFIVGRFLFFIGYKSSYSKRLRGFVVTNYANFAMFIGCFYLICFK